MHAPLTPPKSPPNSRKALLERAEALAGFTLGELAEMANIKVPDNFKRDKGWTGQLLELWLGAQAGSKPEQDFPELGVELKSIPLSFHGEPLETTYVCYTHLTQLSGSQWHTSSVKNKLANVLWFPVQGERSLAPKDRQLGSAFLWTPTPAQEAQLKADWEELMDMIMLGQVEQITARHGEALQIRPKATDGKALTDAIGANGQTIQTRPRGFYLRKSFTRAILQQQFGL